MASHHLLRRSRAGSLRNVSAALATNVAASSTFAGFCAIETVSLPISRLELAIQAPTYLLYYAQGIAWNGRLSRFRGRWPAKRRSTVDPPP